MKRRLFMGLLLSLPALGTAAAQTVQETLTAPEIEALLSGNTIVGTWSGTPYRQYYGPDGTTLYVPQDGRADEGQWRVNAETDEYESWWRSTGWTPYALARTADGNHAWINGDRLEPFRVVPGRQIE
ncbi:hypothetical protein [Roseovarius ramblicola]|uniref:DUF995 domain-containing protein n=1 Tax=Roseovarius ramblicola TaxID=2022336 RepID=A0ABV5HXK4_9RHOB